MASRCGSPRQGAKSSLESVQTLFEPTVSKRLACRRLIQPHEFL